MNYLITGGEGFIGLNLIEHIIKEDRSSSIISIDIQNEGDNKHLRSDRVDFFKADIRKIKDVEAIYNCFDFDYVIHLAAHAGVIPSVENPRFDMENNVLGTFNMLDFARRQKNLKAFIFASSGGTVVGEQEPPVHEDMVLKPMSPYGASKAAGEMYCRAFYGSYDLKTVSLRFSNVYGPYALNKTGNLIPGFIMNAIKDNTSYVYGDGGNVRDFVYVGDLVRAIYSACKIDGIGGEAFQIATNKGYSVNQIIRYLNEVSKEKLGRALKVEYVDPKPGEVRKVYCDISKAENTLNFKPKVNIAFGIEKTFDWFIENMKEDKENA